MATSFTRRMNWTPLGEVFTDYPLDSVGVTAFQLQHDLFIRQDLELRDAPAGGGTLLVEDTDYTLSGEDTYISDLVTEAVGSGRNAMRYITVINAAYQACALYVSGKYVIDAMDPEDGEEIVTLSDEDYTVPDNTHDVHIDLTTVATEREITLGVIARNLGRTITLQMNNASIEGYEGKLSVPAGEHFLYKGAEYDNLYVHFGGDRVSIKVKPDGYYISGGMVNPVALEPDIGGGWHLHNFLILNNLDPVDTNWHEVTSLDPELPDGVRRIRTLGYITGSAAAQLLFSDSNGGVIRDEGLPPGSTGLLSNLSLHLILSSSKSFWYQATSTTISSIYLFMAEYQLGPA